MTALNAPARFLILLLGIAGLSACDTLNGLESQDTVAMAEDGYVTRDTPIQSSRPVKGFNSY